MKIFSLLYFGNWWQSCNEKHIFNNFYSNRIFGQRSCESFFEHGELPERKRQVNMFAADYFARIVNKLDLNPYFCFLYDWQLVSRRPCQRRVGRQVSLKEIKAARICRKILPLQINNMKVLQVTWVQAWCENKVRKQKVHSIMDWIAFI